MIGSDDPESIARTSAPVDADVLLGSDRHRLCRGQPLGKSHDGA